MLSETADCTVASSGILTFFKLFLINKDSYLHLLPLNFMEVAVSHYPDQPDQKVFSFEFKSAKWASLSEFIHAADFWSSHS